MNTLLLYVPLTDPTAPYHSLAYLASYAESKGFRHVHIRDTNIEALLYLSKAQAIDRLRRHCAETRSALEARSQLGFLDQLRYKLALRGEVVRDNDIAWAMQALRHERTFYDYGLYKRAVLYIQNWLEVLSIQGYPGQFTRGFNINLRGIFNGSVISDLCALELLGEVVAPFSEFYEAVLLPEIRTSPPDLIGINITYASQLPFALWLAARIKATAPEVPLIAGGTEVSGVWKYSCKDDFDAVFSNFNACVIGEGESAFIAILNDVQKRGTIGSDIPNVMVPGCTTSPRHYYERLNELPPPSFSDINFDSYLSPRRLVYYSPTRGCYWNRCAFCDYGLNFGTPTSPWRQLSVTRIISDLKAIALYTDFVYFSVDVLAPGALERLAEAIDENGIHIKWGAEIRLERMFTRDICRKLRKSGCIAVSFGFESASQRVLDLMGKGTSIATVRQILEAFVESGIAVQMMGFTGFPSETIDEAMQTFAFLKQTSHLWTTAGIGTFELTPGSIVAQNPARFSLPSERTVLGKGVINRTVCGSEPQNEDSAKRALIERMRNEVATAEFDRPFAGGIDAPHTLFYLDYYGSRFPKSVAMGTRIADAKDILEVNGTVTEGVLFAPEDCSDIDELSLLRSKLDPQQRMGSSELIQRLESAHCIERRCSASTVFIGNGGLVVTCDGGLREFLELVAERQRRRIPTLQGLNPEDELLVQAALSAGILSKPTASQVEP